MPDVTKTMMDKVLPYLLIATIGGLANLYLDVNTLKATRAQIVTDVAAIKLDVKEFRTEFTQFLIDEARRDRP